MQALMSYERALEVGGAGIGPEEVGICEAGILYTIYSIIYSI
jgi:hypothetical protein